MKSDPPSATLPASAGFRTRRRNREPGSRGRPAARRGQIALVVNRLLDVGVSAVLLVLLALPMLVIAVVVKLSSRGPALYKQKRTGLGGKPFTMYKYRTMQVDAEAETGPVWAKRGDPRCTRAGNVLRLWCLDELPQLFNVLRGDMSLVGPRPERPYFVKQFSRSIAAYDQRHQVRPGITGWAQINGWRGDTSLEKRVEFDLYYIRNWSLWFNLKILLLTPIRVRVDQNGN
ncbi:MAG: exopolysaccharide biosynthesis polyprenyl glycosylphosphotransferase [Pirellulales bacterium]